MRSMQDITPHPPPMPHSTIIITLANVLLHLNLAQGNNHVTPYEQPRDGGFDMYGPIPDPALLLPPCRAAAS